jgi:3-oxoacyl-[acyl-carrier-protein] synthase-3
MPDVHVTGLGAYLPERMLENGDLLAAHAELTVADVERVGVLRRGAAGEHEDVPAMAVAACRGAMAESGVAADALDFLVVVNWSERRYVPDLAPRVQERLGASRAFAFDIGSACSGFIIGLSIARGYLQSPRFSCGIVVAADRSRDRLRPGSRAGLLFGDGAAAAVLERDAGAGFRVRDYELCTDGTRNGIMGVGPEGFLESHIRQRELNELAVASLLRVGQKLLARNGLGFSEVDFIVPHSGTAGIQSMLAGALELPRSKILTNLPSVGNLAAASIPTALRHFSDDGTLASARRVLLLAVGLGWQFVAGLLER